MTLILIEICSIGLRLLHECQILTVHNDNVDLVFCLAWAQQHTSKENVYVPVTLVKKIQTRLRKQIGLSQIEGQWKIFTLTQHMSMIRWNQKKRGNKHLKGKKKNFYGCDSSADIVLMRMFSNKVACGENRHG